MKPHAAAAAELKLSIGCGTSGIKGWVNIDYSPTVLLSRLPFGRRIFSTPDWPRDVRRADVRKRIPFPDSSVACIYSSHTFEHFTYEESQAVARECFRVLRPGGILRIVYPTWASWCASTLLTTPIPWPPTGSSRTFF